MPKDDFLLRLTTVFLKQAKELSSSEKSLNLNETDRENDSDLIQDKNDNAVSINIHNQQTN